MAYTYEQVVAAYVAARDARDAIAERHKAELQPYVEKMDKLGAWLLAKLNEQGVQNVKTEAGTAFKAERTSIKIEDPEAFFAFVDAGFPQLVIRSPSTPAVKQFIEDQRGEVPPGLSLNTQITVQVRRA